MRLLIATDAFPPKCGGSGWSTFYLARALRARGHSVEIVLPKPGAPGIHTRVYDDLSVTEFGYTASNVPGLRAWQRAATLDTKFSAFLAARAREADLIHAQHLLTIPAAGIAGRAAKVPVVSTVRDYWPLCLYGTLWRAGSRGPDGDGVICPICRGGELVLCLRQKYGAAAPLARPFLSLIEGELKRRQRALRESDSIVAVSRYVAGTLQGLVDSHKISVVPNLVDIQEIYRLAGVVPENAGTGSNKADSRSEVAQPPYLVFIGKLNELKGANLLPEIVRKAKVNLKVIVVGDGHLTATLSREPNFELRGWLSNREALCLLAHAQVLLFPSRWAEPLSRVLLEAQALGTPTLALDTGGTRDIIDHEVNGLLARDTDEFAMQLARLVNDQGLSRSLSRAAQRLAGERFGDQVIAGKMEAVYERLL